MLLRRRESAALDEVRPAGPSRVPRGTAREGCCPPRAASRVFWCGQITVNHGDRKELRMRGLKELSERVVPFFETHPLRTVKRSSFECFAEVIRLMQRGDHLTTEGLTRIRELAGRMNRGSQNPQRPYAGSPALAGE